jgi:GTPase SAR1 family protein
MIKVDTDIYTNFKLSDISVSVSKIVRAVVIGNAGVGKTSLFNRLCNTK